MLCSKTARFQNMFNYMCIFCHSRSWSVFFKLFNSHVVVFGVRLVLNKRGTWIYVNFVLQVFK